MIDKKANIVLGIFCLVAGIALVVWGFSIGGKLTVLKIDLLATGIFIFLLGIASFLFLKKAKK